jgi:glycine cleavage system H lipoate-binding protein
VGVFAPLPGEIIEVNETVAAFPSLAAKGSARAGIQIQTKIGCRGRFRDDAGPKRV